AITNLDEAEYLAFPRLPGVAELAWTSSNRRTWGDYRQRLGCHAKRFDMWGINYFPSPEIKWQN
ncbi:MAG: beta-N-acetylhexosaminidase, partial [Cyclobacteriaceae bacterium]